MTREEAKKAAEVMIAYAEGKEIELYNFCNWVDTTSPSFNWDDVANTYRIKPEPIYHPFKDAEECWQEMQKHQPFGWMKNKFHKVYALVAFVENNGVMLQGSSRSKENRWNFIDLYGHFTFADGAPFGIKVEE